MGACYDGMTYRGTLSKTEVKECFDEAQASCRHENGHSYSGGIGMAQGLEFKDKEFPTADEAQAWLQVNAIKWEAALCVRAKDAEGKTCWVIGACCAS